MQYAVVYEKADTGYCAYAPDLPGCITTGPDGDPIPEPATVAGNIDLSGFKKAS